MNLHRKFGSLSHGAFHLDVSVHHAHNVFGDGHAKARAFNVLADRSLGAGKGIKDGLDKLLAHADAGILTDKLVAADAVNQGGTFPDGEGDGSPLRGELHRISQNVYKDLAQPQDISQHLLVLDVQDVDF